ncbi:4-hydroxy-3-methylbut-2-en-1-yl diphosphate synthase (ferredoxin), chloroplastic [Iris pallida]|uniref:4-hydroxy-3-methylbut-2-en-1-yl diphosphate synthase (Ferredoxin), chloroplastic n=1 Tax=Iris pallida TaxID=29817 RepID=A0AAX6G3J6_IRIPA|nr:4-hydroxy-3-methylbut-2-en-1-yl diphosphate synthase (ferredoxin), chloroplastic [Iris pallida]
MSLLLARDPLNKASTGTFEVGDVRRKLAADNAIMNWSSLAFSCCKACGWHAIQGSGKSRLNSSKRASRIIRC